VLGRIQKTFTNLLILLAVFVAVTAFLGAAGAADSIVGNGVDAGVAALNAGEGVFELIRALYEGVSGFFGDAFSQAGAAA